MWDHQSDSNEVSRLSLVSPPPREKNGSTTNYIPLSLLITEAPPSKALGMNELMVSYFQFSF